MTALARSYRRFARHVLAAAEASSIVRDIDTALSVRHGLARPQRTDGAGKAVKAHPVRASDPVDADDALVAGVGDEEASLRVLKMLLGRSNCPIPSPTVPKLVQRPVGASFTCTTRLHTASVTYSVGERGVVLPPPELQPPIAMYAARLIIPVLARRAIDWFSMFSVPAIPSTRHEVVPYVLLRLLFRRQQIASSAAIGAECSRAVTGNDKNLAQIINVDRFYKCAGYRVARHQVADIDCRSVMPQYRLHPNHFAGGIPGSVFDADSIPTIVYGICPPLTAVIGNCPDDVEPGSSGRTFLTPFCPENNFPRVR